MGIITHGDAYNMVGSAKEALAAVTGGSEMTDIQTLRDALELLDALKVGPEAKEALAALDRIEGQWMPERVTAMRLIIDKRHVCYFENGCPDTDGDISCAAVLAAIEKIGRE